LLERFVDRARSAGGRVGAVVVAPNGSEALALEPDTAFFAASVIKLPLVMTLFADAEEGLLSLEERIEIGTRVDGSGVLRDLRDVSAMSLRDLAALAMTVSDNTATNRLIERIGVARVNERLEEWGCRATRLARKLFDWEARSRGLENLMTARECASLLAQVVRGTASGVEADAAVLALLERNTNAARLGLYLPRGVTLGHKDGWGDDPEYVENDAGVVRARSSVIAVGLTHQVAPIAARPLLGLLGLAAAELAGAEVNGLPPEVGGGA
jgi:beta-lactamase class A